MQSILLNGLKKIATIVSGAGKEKKLFILIYHRVLNEPDFMRSGEVDKKTFSWQMELLAKYFNVLPLDVALQRMQNSRLPTRAVSITFDDGYADNYHNALPILNKFSLKATFFIASGYLNGGIMWNDKVIEAIRRLTPQKLVLTDLGLNEFDVRDNTQKANVAKQIINKIKHLDNDKRQEVASFIAAKAEQIPTNLMMTNEQLVLLYQAGMEIGGHTVTHPILAKLDEQIVEQELYENKRKLEQLLNTKIRFFAYPNGKPETDYKLEQIEKVKAVGYQAALSTQCGVAMKGADPFQLPRFTPWDRQPIKFILRMIHRYATNNSFCGKMK